MTPAIIFLSAVMITLFLLNRKREPVKPKLKGEPSRYAAAEAKRSTAEQADEMIEEMNRRIFNNENQTK